MRITFCIILLCCVFAKCVDSDPEQHQVDFDSFDFSYNDVFSSCFSIHFTNSDTFFMRQHFASTKSDSRKSNTMYFGILSRSEKQTLDSFLTHIPFSNFDSMYYQQHEDGLDYQFYLKKDMIETLIRVHTDSVPGPLATFMNWIVEKSSTMVLREKDTMITFESARDFLPPPLPLLSPRKFSPPRAEESSKSDTLFE